MELLAHSWRSTDGPLHRIAGSLAQELKPHHGRAAIAARMVLATVLTMLCVLAFRLPYGFLAIFYALAISRENPHATIRNGFRIILSNSAGAGFVILGAMFLCDYPLTRFLFVSISFFAVFFVIKTSANFSVAFGFGIMVVAGAALIWLRPYPAEARLETTIGSAFGIALGTVVTIVVEWLLAPSGRHRIPSSHPIPPAHQPVFIKDAFSNPEHLVYALKGCLAGSLCQAIWCGLAWPGLGECIITCVIVAPVGTPGSVRRRFITRAGGVLLGGLLFGIGSQVWVLPGLDSIAGFTIYFAVVTAVAAWLATSSPRLSYFGRQVALAYDVAAFQGFSVRSSLAADWSPQMGIFLGLFVMALIFDVRWRSVRRLRRTAEALS